ncbi:MAG: hypothetical protein PBU97_13720 [Stenotrophomonas maltophilia]
MTVHRDFDHLWRDRCDTSSQRAPRVLIRVFVAPGELERSVAFYEQLQGVVADAGFPFPEAGPTSGDGRCVPVDRGQR